MLYHPEYFLRGKRHIHYCSEEDREVFSRNVAHGEHPVYCCRFDNTSDALVYKLMLQRLSVATLDYLISRYRKQTSGEMINI